MPPTSLPPPPPPSIRTADLNGFTYIVNCPGGEDVGVSPATGAVGGADAIVDIFEIAGYGDVTGDGTEDAVAFLSCAAASGGNLAISNVLVVEATGDGPRQVGSAIDGSSPRLEESAVVVQRYEYLPDDPRCCPSINSEVRLRWDGATWVEA